MCTKGPTSLTETKRKANRTTAMHHAHRQTLCTKFKPKNNTDFVDRRKKFWSKILEFKPSSFTNSKYLKPQYFVIYIFVFAETVYCKIKYMIKLTVFCDKDLILKPLKC